MNRFFLRHFSGAGFNRELSGRYHITYWLTGTLQKFLRAVKKFVAQPADSNSYRCVLSPAVVLKFLFNHLPGKVVIKHARVCALTAHCDATIWVKLLIAQALIFQPSISRAETFSKEYYSARRQSKVNTAETFYSTLTQIVSARLIDGRKLSCCGAVTYANNCRRSGPLRGTIYNCNQFVAVSFLRSSELTTVLSTVYAELPVYYQAFCCVTAQMRGVRTTTQYPSTRFA